MGKTTRECFEEYVVKNRLFILGAGFSANAKLAAVILGAAAPIILTSRSDTEESKQASIIMAAAVN